MSPFSSSRNVLAKNPALFGITFYKVRQSMLCFYISTANARSGIHTRDVMVPCRVTLPSKLKEIIERYDFLFHDGVIIKLSYSN